MQTLFDCVCPICASKCAPLDVVDFNRSCEEPKGVFLPLSGTPVYYVLCERCGFCFAPEMCGWSVEEFEKKVYNADYIKVDPDYVKTRPEINAKSLISMFGKNADKIRHLDYGGGDGLLSKTLAQAGWNSTSYDPFVNKDVDVGTLGKFDLITALEVFEHVPDINKLMADLKSLIAPQGLIFFSTLLSDGQIGKNRRLNWWYASPRNGHISLYSGASLGLIAKKHGLGCASANNLCHLMWTTVPVWAQHLITAPAKTPA